MPRMYASLLNAHIWSNALRIWSNAQFVKCALDCHASGGRGGGGWATLQVLQSPRDNNATALVKWALWVLLFLHSSNQTRRPSYIVSLVKSLFLPNTFLIYFFYCGPLSRKAHCTHLFVKVHLLPLTVCPMLATNLRTTTRKVQNWQERCTQYRVVSVSRVIWRLVWS